ncbi:glycosyltransferase family 61 protein [Nocardioides rubriscoriae]|uniref:glycosyltransferase family 61 protein n=1 Tax=Nocardioides rubriscoriae TaxID=642762 RepID=UPI0011DFF9DA|nr:glycosyltransferase 61 family protein [Nocardioides rubriscoriae]
MTWAPATSPREAPQQCDLVTVDDAVLTPFVRARLRSSSGPATVMTGAVHDVQGLLVPASQRWWEGDRSTPAAGDPDAVRVPDRAPRLEGTWLYAGHWALHFGHFLVEVLTNLWPDPQHAGPVGIVAHRSFRGPVVPPPAGPGSQPMTLRPWQADLVALAGYAGLEVQVVRHRAVRVEHLVVPERPVVIKSWAAAPAVALWRRVSEAVGERGGHERVFFSRAAFHRATDNPRRDRSDDAWDAHLDQTFEAAGFLVVHPETLPVAEQVALVRGAAVLAGSSGSALHLSAFAAPGTRVLEVGDERSPAQPMASQRMIDAACGHLAAFVGYRDRAGLAAVLGSL